MDDRMIAQLTTALADRYAIERPLGSGGMATVYLARDLKHDRLVALKVLRPELGAVLGAERFLSEIRITAQLQHPHIIPLIDSGQTDGMLWYVLPYISGESLRDRLTREGQLSISETVRIATQIASALDFAHARGVIHRDVKPQNVLLFEGEAMLADFGIALAVREAGGDRLTHTGLSLGTPEYMSPEQASGDRRLDARTDVYSLGAVVYEMLAGDPPFTGRNAQAIIARLLTEIPTRVRTLRATVPPGMDEAIARALAKVPADRFENAGAFAGALAGGPTQEVRVSAPRFRSRRIALAGAGVAALVLATGIWAATRDGKHAGLIPVTDRRQVTFLGGAYVPALSYDGSRVAYAIRRCDPTCHIDIQIQDIDGGAPLTLVRDVPGVYSLDWSPSGRHVSALGTIGGQYGAHILPTLGGPSVFLGCCWATFWPTGDSVLTVRGSFSDDSSMAVMTTLGGVPLDSFRLAPHSWTAIPLHGATLLGVGRVFAESLGVDVIDRNGLTRDSVRVLAGQEGSFGGRDDWMYISTAKMRGGRIETLRWTIDRGGRLASAPDTVALDVPMDNYWRLHPSADGRLAYSQGPDERALWALSLEDALTGHFDATKQRVRSTAFLRGDLSPDGRWILVARPGYAPDIRRLSIAPFDGGDEIALGEGAISHQSWTSDGNVVFAESGPSGARVIEVRMPSRQRREIGVLDDKSVTELEVMADGRILWVPEDHRPLKVVRPGGSTRFVDSPSWISLIAAVDPSPDGVHVLVTGWTRGIDTLIIATLNLEAGTWTSQWKGVVEAGSAKWVRDGSILVTLSQSRGRAVLYRLRRGSGLQEMGSIPALTVAAEPSRDGRRLLVTTGEYKGDVWIARLGEPR